MKQPIHSAYDALGRQVATQDARGAVHSRGYDALGRVAWESDPATNGTWYAYDALGRRVAVTNSLGQVTHTAYDAEDRAIATWGATYPVAYEYDSQGRMTAMATTRDNDADFAALAAQLASGASLASLASPMSLDLTTWFYDEATGLLTNKVYADGKGTAYSYTPDGKLASRLWARGISTTYTYTNGSSLVAIDYSDDTPDVSFQHDRLGRITSAIVAGSSTNAYAYDQETQTLSVETQNGIEINRTTDVLGRDTGFSLGSIYSVQYAYDAYGRFVAVTSLVSSVPFVANYSYLDGTDLLSGMTASSGFLWTRAYESGRSLITSVENRFGEVVISRYDYENDELGRRTSRADSGNATRTSPRTSPAARRAPLPGRSTTRAGATRLSRRTATRPSPPNSSRSRRRPSRASTSGKATRASTRAAGCPSLWPALPPPSPPGSTS